MDQRKGIAVRCFAYASNKVYAANRWTGKDRTKFLETLVVGDLQGLPVGSSTLSVFTNENGGIIDDTVINKASETSFYVVSNAGCAEKDLKHIREQMVKFKQKGGDVDVKVLDMSLIALQGPKACSVLETLTSTVLNDFAFMSSRKMAIKGIPAYVSRCGYTGEDGFEVAIIDLRFPFQVTVSSN